MLGLLHYSATLILNGKLNRRTSRPPQINLFLRTFKGVELECQHQHVQLVSTKAEERNARALTMFSNTDLEWKIEQTDKPTPQLNHFLIAFQGVELECQHQHVQLMSTKAEERNARALTMFSNTDLEWKIEQTDKPTPQLNLFLIAFQGVELECQHQHVQLVSTKAEERNARALTLFSNTDFGWQIEQTDKPTPQLNLFLRAFQGVELECQHQHVQLVSTKAEERNARGLTIFSNTDLEWKIEQTDKPTPQLNLFLRAFQGVELECQHQHVQLVSTKAEERNARALTMFSNT